jgi:hypothetical protein
MKLKILIISIIIGLSSCNDDTNDCTDTILNVNHLETEYGCTDANVDLSENYMIVSNPLYFSEFVDANCQSEVDFTTYDLIIGKKGLTNGLISIDYELIENCETENQYLTITFNLNETAEAPNVTYNALIPKLEENQELSVELIVNY